MPDAQGKPNAMEALAIRFLAPLVEKALASPDVAALVGKLSGAAAQLDRIESKLDTLLGYLDDPARLAIPGSLAAESRDDRTGIGDLAAALNGGGK